MTSNKSLVLRVCSSNMTSYGGFKWPGAGVEAVASDWRATQECGRGLHGWLHGQGDHDVAGSLVGDADTKWLVVEVATDSIIHLGGKVKYPRGLVRFVGDRKAATDYLLEHDPMSREVAVIGATRQVGDQQAVMVGAFGQATSGTRGTSTSGNYGTSTSGYGGTSTSGTRGTSTSGNYGTSTSGTRGTSTSGTRGTSQAGENGEIRIKKYDSKKDRYRTVVGAIGEDGLKPDTPYQLDGNGKFVEVRKP